MHLPTSGSEISTTTLTSTPLQAERCQCCPYGFHIDLDFVNFAEDVVAGRKNPETVYGNRRQTPVAFADSKKAKQQLNGSIKREQTPPSAFVSISKRSLNDIVNDLNELTQYAEGDPRQRKLETDENIGFSTLPAKISSKDFDLSPPPEKNGHLVSQTPLSPTLTSSMNNRNWNELRDTLKTPLTVSANEEVQQILEHQPRSTDNVRRFVTSAPASPVPRTCYTAIGQALSQLRDRTPISQISGSRIDHSYTPTITTPRRSVFNSTLSSIPIGHSPAAKPPLPTRYFDGGRRNRLLSPDPETSSASPSVLRSSNLQSRTYFKPTNSLNAAQPNPSKTIPYRSRLNGTPNFNGGGSALFDSFASVKRSMGLRVSDENRILPPTSYTPSYTYTPSVQNTQTQTPPIKFASSKNYRDSPTQTHQQYQNNESQTNNTHPKNVSVSTPSFEKKSVGTLVLPVQSTVSLDTSDLEPPAKKPQLSTEFQYCIGHESEHLYEELPSPKRKHSKSTSAIPYTSHASTLCRPLCINNRTQTEFPMMVERETQTSNNWLMKEVRAMMENERAERKNVDKRTETDEDDNEFILVTCSRCRHPIEAEQYEKITDDDPVTKQDISQSSSPHTITIKSSSSSSDQDEGLGLIEPLDFDLVEQQDKSDHISPPQIQTSSPKPATPHHTEDTRSTKSEDEEREMLANLDQLAHLDPDRFSLASVQTVICVQPPQEEAEEAPKLLDPTRTEAIRKLLTEPQPSGFNRESSTNRSYRVEKKALDLDYILEKHPTREKSPTSLSSTPSDDPGKPLKEMVVLKKFVSIPSSFPDPVPAKIPRPKFCKFSHEDQTVEQAETPDEADEAIDKLTPLRSELHSLDSWRDGPHYRRALRHHQFPNYSNNQPESSAFNSISQSPPQEDFTDEEDDIANDPVSTSNSSITSLEEDSSNDDESPVEFELTAPLKEALETLNKHLLENTEAAHSTDWAHKYVQHGWLQISTRKSVSANAVKNFINALSTLSPKILETAVNFVDRNGNSALHYSVSHENYEVISTLLDTKVCKVDVTNKAGYSSLMLAALCTIKNETESAIIQRLFERGDVNAKAVYHGQTALMLSVSHGRVETTNLLLKLGADLNIQDIDGSTALMCAAEHGHKELVKILLQRPNIDASLMDCDNQTALSISVENGHRDIGIMLYNFLNQQRL